MGEEKRGRGVERVSAGTSSEVALSFARCFSLPAVPLPSRDGAFSCKPQKSPHSVTIPTSASRDCLQPLSSEKETTENLAKTCT